MKYKSCFFHVITWLAFFLSLNVQAQTDKWNIDLSYQSSPVNLIYMEYFQMDYNLNILNVDMNYCFSSKIEAGVFGGWGFAKHNGPSGQKDLLFGINGKMQVLPFFVDSEKIRFKLYFIGKAGVDHNIYLPNWEGSEKKNKFIGSVFLGSSYYFTKHIGVFVEGGYEKMHQSNFNVRYGLTLKF